MSTTLLVEPDLELSLTWQSALRDVGHDVVTASGPHAAIAHVREGGIDVIVLDAISGRLAVTEMVAALSRLPDAPPLLLVSDTLDGPELSARIGAAGFLLKPCEPDDLVREIGRITGGQVRSSQPSLRVPAVAFDDEPTGPEIRVPAGL